MMTGTIRPLVRERVERRDNIHLPSAWVSSDQVGEGPAALSWLTTHTPKPSHRAPRAPVLVMLGLKDTTALAELVTNAAAGARMYVLVPPGWGQSPLDPQWRQAPNVLIRRVAEVPATGIHTAGKATLWLGAAWNLRLDAAQAEAFRHVFLRLFWHDALEEAWSGGGQLLWRTAMERPFDVPELPRAASVQRVGPDARLQGDVQDAWMHLAGGTPPDATPRRLWFPAGPDHHERLARLVRGGTEVVWHDRDLPDLVVHRGHTTGEVLLPGTRGRLRVALTAEQASEVARVLETPGRWRFGVDLRIGDPATAAASFWLPGESGARPLEGEQILEVPDVQAASLRAVSETNPVTVPAPQPLALSVRYRWNVLPPRPPAGTEEDTLIGRWRKIDEDWQARIGRVREALQAAESDRGRIRQAFSRLMGAMLGFEYTHGRLIAQIDAMEVQRPAAAGPSGAPAMLSQLADLEEQTQTLRANLEAAEGKAREDEAREKQEAAWRSRVEAAKQDLTARRTELGQAETQERALADEWSSIESQIKTADKKLQKDLKARRHRVSDDRSRAEKELRRLRDVIAELERTIAQPFTFDPPARPPAKPAPAGRRFVPASASVRPASAVPDEALPEVGMLRSHKGKRYLVIQQWEDLDAGEAAASRLSAQLVAPETR